MILQSWAGWRCLNKMLDIHVSIEGEKVIIEGLERFARHIPSAAQRGLSRAAKGIHRKAHDFLSGPGAKASNVSAGGYPVPIRTGHLRRMLNWLEPGQSKTASGITFTTGPMEAIIFNAAEYAMTIHEGKKSSAKYGARPFLTDALEKFNQGAKIAKIIREEVQKEIDRI